MLLQLTSKCRYLCILWIVLYWCCCTWGKLCGIVLNIYLNLYWYYTVDHPLWFWAGIRGWLIHILKPPVNGVWWWGEIVHNSPLFYILLNCYSFLWECYIIITSRKLELFSQRPPTSFLHISLFNSNLFVENMPMFFFYFHVFPFFFSLLPPSFFFPPLWEHNFIRQHSYLESSRRNYIVFPGKFWV